jgi:hypothetical protein
LDVSEFVWFLKAAHLLCLLPNYGTELINYFILQILQCLLGILFPEQVDNLVADNFLLVGG